MSIVSSKPRLIEIIARFINRKREASNQVKSLEYIDNKLMSKGTCIGQHHNGKIYVNSTYYDRTTTRHQNNLFGYLNSREIEYIEVSDIPINTKSLVEEDK